MKNRKIIVVLIFITLIIFGFVLLIDNEENHAGRTLVNSDDRKEADNYHYYMKNQNGNVIVYNKDHTVYEYTDLIPDFLPEEIEKELKLGIYFQNQEELYEFLETYSS